MANTNRSSDKLAWGVVLIAFGILILVDRLNLFADSAVITFLHSPGTYFLLAGIIFLIFKPEKMLGIVLTAVGLIIHSDLFFGWMTSYRSYMIPVILLIVGIIMVLNARRGRR